MVNYNKYANEQWNIIHVLAKKSNTYETHEAFIRHMIYIRDNYKCEMCRRHIKAYINKYGFPKWKGSNTAFDWSVLFHNRVNYRLNKEQMSVDIASNLY